MSRDITWLGEEDLNPHALTGTGTLSQRVCQFRHSDVAIRKARMRRASVAESIGGATRFPEQV